MFRKLAALGSVSALLLLGLVGVANAEDDVECSGFGTREQAQAAFDGSGPGDPYGLDPDGDGIVCAELPSALDPGVDPELGDDDAIDDDPSRDYSTEDVVVPNRIDTGGGAMAATF